MRDQALGTSQAHFYCTPSAALRATADGAVIKLPFRVRDLTLTHSRRAKRVSLKAWLLAILSFGALGTVYVFLYLQHLEVRNAASSSAKHWFA